MHTRSTLIATLYAVGLGLTGLGALIYLTDADALFLHFIPLAFFAALSFFIKRAGFHAAPEVTHSLVGIVDLAAVLIFGPILGAWVAASSGFAYLLLNAWRREQHTLRNLLETPIFNAGLKTGMAYASSHLYLLLGGTFAPRVFTPALVPAFLAALLAWFTVDHVGWGLLEFLRGGKNGLTSFLRSILFYSLMMELLPLPFAIVIAVVYSASDLGVFALMSLGLFGTAVIVQRFADASAHLERRRNELAVLNEFGQAVARAAFEPDKIIELLCEHSRRIVPAELCRIELFDPEHAPEGGTLLAVETTTNEVRHPHEPAPTSPLIEYFASHREPIRAQNLAKAFVYPLDATGAAVSAGEQVRVDGLTPRSALFVPMFAGEELIGVVGLFATQSDAFFAIHARNLMSMASQAAVAIQNARLYTIERKRAGQLAAVSEVSGQVASVLDLNDLLQQVVNRIGERFGYGKVHIFTVDRDAGYVTFRASTDPHGAEWRERGWRLRLGLEGIVGWVAAIGEPLRVDDIHKEPRFIMDPGEVSSDTRSELAVPLVVGKEVVGVLDVQSSTVGAFTDEDLFVLKTLAAQIAVAVENARLFDAQREEAWYLNVLLQVAQNLSATTDLEDSLETVVRITPLLVGVARCAVLLYRSSDETFVPAKAYGLTAEQQEAFNQLRLRADTGNALDAIRREHRPVVVEESEDNPLIRPEIRDMFGIRALLLAPLMTRGELVGAMLVDQGTRTRHFSPHEIDVVMGIANQAAVAIEGARLQNEAEAKKRFEYELGLARQIQQSFLPDACPVLPGYETCSTWETAREVGGDFYDFISLRDGQWAIEIADVSDKGIAAALFMALSRTILRTMAIGKPTPHEALDRANEVILADAHSEMFVTVFFSELDPATGRLTYVNAGHNPPLWYHGATREVTTLKGHGIALGVIPTIALQDHAIQLEPGDLLLLYTDGVTEAINASEEEFGAERLASIVAMCGHLPATDTVNEVTRSLAEFTGNVAPADDVTMVAIKRVSV